MCPLMDEWINNTWFTHTMEYYSALKRKEILMNATAWKKLEDIMLSETNQSPKTNAIWFRICDVLRESNSQSQKVKSCPTLWNPWTIACQAPLSMGLSRQEYWSGLPCPPAWELPDPGIEPGCLIFPALAGRFFITSATWDSHRT